MKPKQIFYAIVAMLILCIPTSCDTEDDDTIKEEDLYNYASSAMLNCCLDIYNQNIAGTPTGSKDMTVNGPSGGTVIIKGNTSVSDNTINSVDLTYTMMNVKYVYKQSSYTVEITMNGSLNEKGTFKTDYKSETFSSTNLSIEAKMYSDSKSGEFSNMGEVNLTCTISKVVGYMFGHTIAY